MFFVLIGVGIGVADDVDIVVCVGSAIVVNAVVVGLVFLLFIVDVVLLFLLLGGVLCVGLVLVVPSVLRWM